MQIGTRGVKYEYNDILFDSKNEVNHYKYIEKLDFVKIITTHKTFHLLDGFKWFDLEKGKIRKTREMVYTPDFILEVKGLDKPIAFEVKGYARKDYMIRKKLFLNSYRDEYYFIESNSVKQCEKIFNKIRGDYVEG